MKTKSLVLILALLLSALSIALTKPSSGMLPNQFYFDPNPKAGHTGTDVSIAVKLKPTGIGLHAYQFIVRWDQRVLRYRSIAWGWLEDPEYATLKLTDLSTVQNELNVFEGFYDSEHAKDTYFATGDFNQDGVVDSTDLGIIGAAWGAYEGPPPDPNWVVECDLLRDGVIDSSDLGVLGIHWDEFGMDAPVILVTITWTVVANGFTSLEFTDHVLYTTGTVQIESTAENGYFYTYEPFVDFTWTPTSPRIEENITFDGSASYSHEPITSYSWSIDGQENGTSVTTTGKFHTYSKTEHDVALTVTDSGGHSSTLHKSLIIDRDLEIFGIWPSMEDLQGGLQSEFVSGKYVIVCVGYANLGTITEYTDNTYGDFPATAEIQLYLIRLDGAEEKIGSTYGPRIRRYWNSTGPDSFYRCYDWAPGVDAAYYLWWDLWGAAPETDLYFKANFTDTATGEDPFVGDTDLSNNELWYGPFNITTGCAHDVRIEAIYNLDNGYYTPIQPYGTTFKLGYGGRFDGAGGGPYEPIGPGNLTDVYVDLSNVGVNDETVTWYLYLNGAEILYSETDTLDVATGYFSFVYSWEAPDYEGTYTLSVYVEPAAGETGYWATWDNNIPGQSIPYFNAYDDWVIQSSFPP